MSDKLDKFKSAIDDIPEDGCFGVTRKRHQIAFYK